MPQLVQFNSGQHIRSNKTMKKLMSMVMVLATAGLASAGELEKMAASADLTVMNFTAMHNIAVPVASPEAIVMAPVSKDWIKAVKKAYLTGT